MTTAKFSPGARRRARQLAVQALYQWQLAGASLSTIELEFRQDNDMARVDGAYFSELLHQVPATLSELDAHLATFLDRDLAELTPVELTILRIGAYEMVRRTDVPYRVVINEGVDLAKRFGATDGHKYINGVLDKLARNLRAQETAP